MTSEETIALAAAVADEWDDDTLASLKDDDGPSTTSELVLVPGYTQSAWDRRQVRQLKAAMDAETYLWDNLHKTDEVLVRDLLLLLGYPRAAHTHMSTGFVTGAIYGAVATPAKPKRKRASQARKAVRGVPPDAA